MNRLALVLVLGLASCGGSSKPSPQEPDAGQSSGEGSVGTPGEGDPGDAPGPSGAPLDDAECTQLADHIVDVSMAARRPPPNSGAAAKPGDGYTAEDAEVAKRELRQSLRPACPQLSRREFRCAMAARTAAELGACQK